LLAAGRCSSAALLYLLHVPAALSYPERGGFTVRPADRDRCTSIATGSAMKRILFLVILLLILGLLFAAHTASQSPPTTRRHLAQDAVLQGYPCARGYAWFYSDGKLNRCTVSHDAAFGEAQIPAGSIIQLHPDGTTWFVMLAHNATILDYPAMGGSLLGPSEGPITSFYPSGKLRSLYLVDDRTIQGVPCRSGKWGIVTDRRGAPNVVEFYENGRLHACKLTGDYRGHHAGQQIRLRLVTSLVTSQ
jgi:hypothetical protein